MEHYITNKTRISATRYSDLIKYVRRLYHDIEKQTKRKPYIRSAYFKKEKIFFDYYWYHLDQKSFTERRKRLRYFKYGIDLIRNSRIKPVIKINPHRKRETLYRFTGVTKEGDVFHVQIKEDLKTKQKYLMSIFCDN